MELSNEHALLADRLTIAAHFRVRGRLARMLVRPRRMLYPKLVQLSGGTTEVAAETFWGERLRVILPELLSINIWRYGFFEEDVCRFLLGVLRPGMTFVDIGAHFGFFTRLGSFLVGDGGRVLSFEPTPGTFRQLAKNVEGRANVEICDYAAFDHETQLKIYDFGVEFSAYNSAFGMRRDPKLRPPSEEVLVKARKVDDVLKEKGYEAVHLIKIDAESSEMQVLSGLAETLQRHRPKLILETGDFDLDGVPKTEQIVRWLEGMGYLPYEATADGSLQTKEIRDFDNIGGNLLFMPSNDPQRCV